MLERKIAENYAKALFKIPGTLDQIQKRQRDLESIADMIKLQPKIIHILGCPELKIEDRIAILQKKLEIDLDVFVERFIQLILKRGKVRQIVQVASEYHKLVIDSLEAIDVEVTSAESLSDRNKDIIIEKLQKRLQKKINLIETIDPSLLAGFSLMIHNQLLDLSVKGKLMKLKLKLLKADI